MRITVFRLPHPHIETYYWPLVLRSRPGTSSYLVYISTVLRYQQVHFNTCLLLLRPWIAIEFVLHYLVPPYHYLTRGIHLLPLVHILPESISLSSLCGTLPSLIYLHTWVISCEGFPCTFYIRKLDPNPCFIPRGKELFPCSLFHTIDYKVLPLWIKLSFDFFYNVTEFMSDMKSWLCFYPFCLISIYFTHCMFCSSLHG